MVQPKKARGSIGKPYALAASKKTASKPTNVNPKRKTGTTKPAGSGVLANKKAKTTGETLADRLKKVPNIGENASFTSHLFEGMKKEGWPRWKFPLRETRQANALAVASLTGAQLWGTGPYVLLEDPDVLADWIRKNKNELFKLLNKIRSQVYNDLKSAANKLWDKTSTLPSVEKIVGCATRDSGVINLNDAEDYEIFDWYWNVYLVKVTGDKTIWPTKIRHYQIISEAMTHWNPELPCVTPEHKAYGVAAWENYRECWIKQFVLKNANKSCNLYHCKKQRKDKEGNVLTDYAVEGDRILMIDKKYSGK